MTTTNGKNKLERQINKAKKYLNLDLEEFTTKYLKVSKNQDLTNFYVIFLGHNEGNELTFKEVQNGAKEHFYCVNPINSTKTMWFKTFGAIESEYWNQSKNDFLKFIIVKPFFTDDKTELSKLALGADGVFNLSDMVNNPEFAIKRN